jgi:hypothetical protein
MKGILKEAGQKRIWLRDDRVHENRTRAIHVSAV